MMPNSFPATSRYALTEVTTMEAPDGGVTAYLRRRFVPQPERFALLRTHSVVQGERLDNVTAAYLGDPEQFWQVADANRALRPDDLIVVGRLLRITLPEGIPGAPDA
jgi:hypothetical protein